MGTLELKWGPNGDPKTEKGPHGDRVPQMGTHVGTVDCIGIRILNGLFLHSHFLALVINLYHNLIIDY